MVSYVFNKIVKHINSQVLILIVVDDGLVLLVEDNKGERITVLILIVVDDGLVLLRQSWVSRLHRSS